MQGVASGISTGMIALDRIVAIAVPVRDSAGRQVRGAVGAPHAYVPVGQVGQVLLVLQLLGQLRRFDYVVRRVVGDERRVREIRFEVGTVGGVHDAVQGARTKLPHPWRLSLENAECLPDGEADDAVRAAGFSSAGNATDRRRSGIGRLAGPKFPVKLQLLGGQGKVSFHSHCRSVPRLTAVGARCEKDAHRGCFRSFARSLG